MGVLTIFEGTSIYLLENLFRHRGRNCRNGYPGSIFVVKAVAAFVGLIVMVSWFDGLSVTVSRITFEKSNGGGGNFNI
jgi:uncharacterized membrane protein